MKYNDKQSRSYISKDERKIKHARLFHDKRVHSILECPTCGNSMTAAEAKRNHGVCDLCAENVVVKVEV